MNDSFQKRVLRITITLAEGTFASSGGNTIVLEGYRASAQISQAGGSSTGHAAVDIFGMLQQDMNQLTSLSFDNIDKQRKKQEIFHHKITIEADGVFCFLGNIVNAWGNYNAQPNVFLHIEAVTQFFDKVNPYPASSFQGEVDVATLFDGFAKAMNLTLENNGVNIKVENPYFAGTVMAQAASLAAQVNIDLWYQGYTMVIINKGESRSFPVPLISKDTGLVGYPSFDNSGVTFRCLFNPAIHFFSTVEIDSPVIRANGKWIVNTLRYTLESEKPGGAWFMDIRAMRGASYGG
ncbi:MAG: hypothetical protein WC714_28665 [Candidatus Obscuribacterales bacterium]|jgi:hypothetical protein